MGPEIPVDPAAAGRGVVLPTHASRRNYARRLDCRSRRPIGSAR